MAPAKGFTQKKMVRSPDIREIYIICEEKKKIFNKQKETYNDSAFYNSYDFYDQNEY